MNKDKLQKEDEKEQKKKDKFYEKGESRAPGNISVKTLDHLSAAKTHPQSPNN